MHIWLISPYHTGSHQAWAEGYARHSRHTVTLLTMAGRFWKWRMQGGAVELAMQAQQLLEAGPPPDLILATDMLNLPAWLGLMRRSLPASIPIALYMHENQLTYPWRPGEGRDLSFAVINWLSQLAADAVFFNSRYHLEAWFGELPNLLKHFPDFNHLEKIDAVRARSEVLPVGIEARAIARAAGCRTDVRRRAQEGAAAEAAGAHAPPLILWNQRWEYDKRPDRFFALLYRLRAEGIPFRLAVAGENFRRSPQEFGEAAERLADAIVHWGYVDSREAYWSLLAASDLAISTADHEFFGVSVVEAIAAGAFPLLPNRLSYPEIVPPALHAACLYNDDEELFVKAAMRLRSPRPVPPSLRRSVLQRFDWRSVAAAYDARFEALLKPSLRR